MAQQNPFCQAQPDFFSNTVVCVLCGLVWDASELSPPACRYEINQDKREKQS